MNLQTISQSAIERRAYWIDEIVKISGRFGDDSGRVEAELNAEIKKDGTQAILDHLRLCSSIPESYGHDSSEEKLYSKYTDALISAAYAYIGLRSFVITERANCADVEVIGDDFSFVADAKVFRLSRTAKNQKDFKVQAMDGWKRGKPYAMVVCPLYQLPTKSSQIYEQAAARNVCILSYSHLAVIIQLSEIIGKESCVQLVKNIFRSVETLNPSRDASPYWKAINNEILNHSEHASNAWKLEKLATVESISISKEIALTFLSSERERIIRMTHAEAIQQLLDVYKIDSRINYINGVTDNGIMGVN